MKRLYIVVRDDLAPGMQIAQACHAAHEYGTFGSDDVGDNLVVLSASPERLTQLAAQAAALSLSHCAFFEPDLGNSLTALALSGSASPLVSSLPLALRDSPRLSNLTA